MRKWFTAAAAICTCAAVGTSFAMAASPAAVNAVLAPFHWKANGKSFDAGETFDNGTERVPGSMNYKGTTYIPIRMAAEALGLSVEWDAGAATATLVDSESDDDPISDVPGKVPSASYKVTAKLQSAAKLYRETNEESGAAGGLKRGQEVVVLAEAGGGWLKAIAGGAIGYIRTDATDYVPSAERPEWERTADSIIEAGLAYLGAPYEFDADLGQTNSFDCSSFVNYLYEMHGMDMPRNSRQQSAVGKEVAFEQLRKGDLLFFTTPKRADNKGVDRIGHVAIYVGDGMVLHTFRKGIGVAVTQLDDNWKGRFVKAMRVISS